MVLALATHSAADPGFSTSGSGGAAAQQGRHRSAPGSPTSRFFLFGYSVWWAVAGRRARLARRAGAGCCARTPSAPARRPTTPALACSGSASALLLAASASLEWTRLYQWEALVAGGHAGGVLGYGLGRLSQSLLGFAGSGVLWIAVLVAGVSLALRFSWLRVGRAHRRAAIESLRTRRASSARARRGRAPRRGGDARARARCVEVEHELQEQHLPIVIEPTLVDVPKSTRVVKERQKPLFTELVDTKLPQVDLLDSAPQRARDA